MLQCAKHLQAPVPSNFVDKSFRLYESLVEAFFALCDCFDNVLSLLSILNLQKFLNVF
jgi:hypothetical protein